jgi:hypothetical protein
MKEYLCHNAAESSTATRGQAMAFHKGQRVRIFRKSSDESWESFMDQYVGLAGVVTDPDTSKNDPEALIEVTLDDKGTYRFPQDCLESLE